MPDELKTCAVTGASGYVGARIAQHLATAGWRVIRWGRNPPPGEASVQFQLGEEVAPASFAGVHALVHCAYDFRPRRWHQISEVNVRGSEKLLRAARAAGVERIVFLSSLSAFDGCRSLYGRAKLEIEMTARSVGAVVIRPGLVYGRDAGGVFGGLVKQVRQSRFVPLLDGGRPVQYLVHDEDLGRFVARCAGGNVPSAKPIALAHNHSISLRRLLVELAGVLDRRVTFLPVPWRAAWLILKTLEAARLPAPFRSDSLIGLIYQNPAPDFSLAESLGAECRPFQARAVAG